MGFFSKFINLFKTANTVERERNVEEFEDLFMESDFGAALSYSLSKTLLKKAKELKVYSENDIKKIISDELSNYITEYKFIPPKNETSLILLLGVNGSGKTTTCAKLALKYKNEGYKTLLAAADTFRAAGMKQVVIHAEKLGVDVIASEKSIPPAAVIYDALDAAKSKGSEIIIADTAGRLHTKENLIKETQKIDKIVKSKINEKNYVKFLVLDGTHGQNLFSQAEIFDKALGIDALVVTKLDSGAKGGGLIKISKELSLPIAFTGYGEGYEDLAAFNRDKFLENLLN